MTRMMLEVESEYQCVAEAFAAARQAAAETETGAV